MIVRVQAVPVENMRIIRDNGISRNIRIISIVDPDSSFVFNEDAARNNDILQFRFDDVDPDWFTASSINAKNFVLFTTDDAEEIISALKRWHAEEMQITLIINCMAGISRSAAIAEFVRRLYGVKEGIGITDAQFCLDNPVRFPNAHVLRLLMRAWMEMEGVLKQWSRIPLKNSAIFCTKCGEPLMGGEIKTGVCEKCRI